MEEMLEKVTHTAIDETAIQKEIDVKRATTETSCTEM